MDRTARWNLACAVPLLVIVAMPLGRRLLRTLTAGAAATLNRLAVILWFL
jgi:hypothetical protein